MLAMLKKGLILTRNLAISSDVAGIIVFTMNSLVNKGMDHPKFLIIVCEVVGENAWGVDECGEGGEVGGVAGGGDGHQDVRRREPFSGVANLLLREAG